MADIKDHLSVSLCIKHCLTNVNYKNNNLEDSIWQSIIDQLSLLGSCCSVFYDEALASIKCLKLSQGHLKKMPSLL